MDGGDASRHLLSSTMARRLPIFASVKRSKRFPPSGERLNWFPTGRYWPVRALAHRAARARTTGARATRSQPPGGSPRAVALISLVLSGSTPPCCASALLLGWRTGHPSLRTSSRTAAVWINLLDTGRIVHAGQLHQNLTFRVLHGRTAAPPFSASPSCRCGCSMVSTVALHQVAPQTRSASVGLHRHACSRWG